MNVVEDGFDDFLASGAILWPRWVAALVVPGLGIGLSPV